MALNRKADKSESNPFDRLTDAAVESRNDDQAAELMSRARASLVMGRGAKAAFFATLALKKHLIPQRGLGTMMTDGKNVFYDPDWVVDYPLPEVVTMICHEMLHTAAAHHARQGGRDLKTWNIACDLAINPILRSAGFTMPNEVLYPGEGPFAEIPAGLSAEASYPYLLKPRQEQPQDDGQEQGEEEPPPQPEPSEGPQGTPGVDPGQCGGIQPPQDSSAAGLAQAEADAQMELAAAEQAGQMRGDLGADLKRVCQEVIRPKVDWRDILREFVSRKVKQDYNWARPNRRYLEQGLYLPSRSGETIGALVLTVDCSGSIGGEILEQFAGCLEGIIESWPDVNLTILYHDVPVTNRQEWTPEDGDLRLEPHGGGGTSHRPVFEEILSADEPPAAVLCLTDCYTYYPETAGDVPVLWCVVGNKNPEPPFGQVVIVE